MHTTLLEFHTWTEFHPVPTPWMPIVEHHVFSQDTLCSLLDLSPFGDKLFHMEKHGHFGLPSCWRWVESFKASEWSCGSENSCVPMAQRFPVTRPSRPSWARFQSVGSKHVVQCTGSDRLRREQLNNGAPLCQKLPNKIIHQSLQHPGINWLNYWRCQCLHKITSG